MGHHFGIEEPFGTTCAKESFDSLLMAHQCHPLVEPFQANGTLEHAIYIGFPVVFTFFLVQSSTVFDKLVVLGLGVSRANTAHESGCLFVGRL